MSFIPPFNDPLFLQRSLTGYAQALASLAATFSGPSGAFAPGPAALQASLAEGYRQLFAVGMSGVGTAPASTSPGASGPSFLRFQAAAARWAELMSVIARDAASRLARALQEVGPDAPPITSLAGLRALWIDCGEAAYAEAARQEGFAAAQAELLMATAELTASA